MKQPITKDEAETIAGIIRANTRGLRADARRMAQATIDGGFEFQEHPCIVAALDELCPEWRTMLPVPVVGGGQGRDPWDMEGRGRGNAVTWVLGLVIVAVVAVAAGWVVLG